MPSIKDVAKLANVSTSTVSKVIHHYPAVSDETKTKVLSAIEALDYIPNNAAANLSRKSFNKIALIINVNNTIQSIDELNMKYLFGAFKRANDELLIETVIIFSSMIVNMNSKELTNYFRSMNVNGIIFYGITKYDDVYMSIIESDYFKSVVVDAPIVNEHASSIMINHNQAQYEVAKKTIPSQAKKILYLAGNPNGYVTDMRLAAMKQIEVDMHLEVTYHHANFSELEAYRYVLNHHQFDAIICASDLMAVGALKAIYESGQNIPVSGFDGINLMGYVATHIWTVKQDFFDISYQAVCELESLLAGHSGRHIDSEYEVVQIKYNDVVY